MCLKFNDLDKCEELQITNNIVINGINSHPAVWGTSKADAFRMQLHNEEVQPLKGTNFFENTDGASRLFTMSLLAGIGLSEYFENKDNIKLFLDPNKTIPTLIPSKTILRNFIYPSTGFLIKTNSKEDIDAELFLINENSSREDIVAGLLKLMHNEGADRISRLTRTISLPGIDSNAYPQIISA